MAEQKLAGYPSIDKPQSKYYREKPVREIETEQTIYDLVFKSNMNNMSASAIEYLGVQWSFEKLKTKVDEAASAFYSSGLRCGDVVLFGVSNCPEVVVSLLALNKIGSVSKWFDIRAGEKDIEEYANESSCRYLIAFDMLLPKIQKLISDTCLEKVLIITPADSLSAVKRIGYKIKEKVSLPPDNKFSYYRDFIKGYKDNSAVPCVKYDKSRPSVMIQSSGTTGKPKVIVHSDFSATSCARSLSYSDLPLGKEKIMLDLLPPWIAYAIGEAIVYPLALGSKVILSPTFEPEVIMQYIGKFTISFTAPPPYRYLYDHFEELSDRKRKAFQSMVDCLVSGGDKVSIEENKRFEEKFETALANGYGDNEGWGCLTVNPVKHNRYGSVGIAKYGEIVIAYDNDTEKELPYGEEGEICVLANTMFLYYEGNKGDTDSVKKVHTDGNVWLHTGDLGIIDEDGFVFLKGRLRRVIIRLGFKISAYTIEDKISEHLAVKECVAVEVKDKEEEHVPMAFVLLNEGYTDKAAIIDDILKKCEKELKAHEIPKHIKIVTELPYTQNGKYDFRALEKQGNEYVDSLEIQAEEMSNA